jgi:ubiquinone/menaquinone biosynthesis C-methylase UbiE
MTTHAETDETRQAFDSAAPVYDAAYEGLPGIRRIRAITRRLYLQYFPRQSRLLEINSGTGNDALFLANHAMNVTATDLSPVMLEEVRKKIATNGLGRSIEVRHLSFAQLHQLSGTVFDGAYSNLGGLNCTDELSSVAASLGTLVKKGGFFIATVMPSFCPWETAAFLARREWRSAFRRMARGGTRASLHGGVVRTYYHSPRSFAAAFAPWFNHVRTLGLVVLLPPPNSARAYRLLGRTGRLLETAEDVVAGWPLFRSMGDHYVTVLRRKAD